MSEKNINTEDEIIQNDIISYLDMENSKLLSKDDFDRMNDELEEYENNKKEA